MTHNTAGRPVRQYTHLVNTRIRVCVRFLPSGFLWLLPLLLFHLLFSITTPFRNCTTGFHNLFKPVPPTSYLVFAVVGFFLHDVTVGGGGNHLKRCVLFLVLSVFPPLLSMSFLSVPPLSFAVCENILKRRRGRSEGRKKEDESVDKHAWHLNQESFT